MLFSGKILNQDNLPYANVNISFPDLQGIGTVTDLDGNFSIYNNSLTPFTRVEISHTGCQTIKGIVSEFNSKTISFFECMLQGDEVIVYGNRKTSLAWLFAGLAAFGFYKYKQK